MQTVVTAANPESILAFRVEVPLIADRVDFLYGSLLGLVYGYNPLFTAFTFVSLGLALYTAVIRRAPRMAVFILLIVASSLSSYLLSVFVVVGTLYGATSTWTSTIIRMSHTSLLTILSFRYLYENLKPRHLIAGLLVFLLLASTQIPQLSYAMQRSLARTNDPIDRLSLNYRAPYYRLYLLAKESGKTLVIGGLHMRGIRVYMSMLPNVVLVGVPALEAGFRTLVEKGWDSIYLYDDWFTIRDPSIAGAYPAYYWNLLLSRSYGGYSVETLWVDGESYAMRMMKVGNAS